MLKLIAISSLVLSAAFAQAPLTTAQIAERVAPSVVVIEAKTDSGDVLGSGFIVSKDGKIVTNLHVIRDAKSVSVQLPSGEIFDSASVLATDERRDLAIIHVAGFDLAALDLGNSNLLAVGEPLVVVGSPKGLSGTVTAGILSSIRDSGDGYTVLQTDAAVNPGNSGGPLVNGKGQAVGVVSFKLRSSEGLNFAIPINYVRGLLTELHEPISLAQMRRGLTAKATNEQQDSGVSLKETLDWLKGRIPLGSTHWYIYAAGVGKFRYGTDAIFPYGKQGTVYDIKVVPTRFDSCTVTVEETWVSVGKNQFGPNSADLQKVETIRWTVPLGAVTDVSVLLEQTLESSEPSDPKIATWGVFLKTASKAVLHETHEDVFNKTVTESLDYAALDFSEESTAQRVSEAFKHAVELCRGKEPF